MTVTDIISCLNIASAVFAALAVIFAIAATVITLLYHPFRQEPPAPAVPEIIQMPRKKQVITRIDPADIQTMNRLFEIPKSNYTGWLGATERKEEAP